MLYVSLKYYLNEETIRIRRTPHKSRLMPTLHKETTKALYQATLKHAVDLSHDTIH